MKRYKKFMDGVNASDTLRQRLRELKAPKKRPAAWAKYGSIAAALVLVFGGICAGIHRNARLSGYLDDLFSQEARMDWTEFDTESGAPVPDIAIEDPASPAELGQRTLGGYDVTIGSGSEAVVAHHVLPYIEYGEAEGEAQTAQVAADWDIPQGAARRDLTEEEIIALMGGEDAVNTHLDWGGYQLTGWGAWYGDGSFWGAYITGAHMADSLFEPSFEFAVTAGQLPPTCFAYPHSVTQEVRGLTVTADKCSTPSWISVPEGVPAPDVTHLTVSFMKDGYGYRFGMSSLNEEQAELLVSRLVCRVADKGLELGLLAAAYEDIPVYQEMPERVYTCAVCGKTFPEGTVHNDPYMCTGYPVPDGEICGLPLAPDGAADDGTPDMREPAP